MSGRVTDRTKNRLTLLAMLVLLALTGVVAWAKSPVLGLDLKGGLEVVLKAVPNDPKNPPTDEQIALHSDKAAATPALSPKPGIFACSMNP